MDHIICNTRGGHKQHFTNSTVQQSTTTFLTITSAAQDAQSKFFIFRSKAQLPQQISLFG